jgi:hypothetical protein
MSTVYNYITVYTVLVCIPILSTGTVFILYFKARRALATLVGQQMSCPEKRHAIIP